jgi:hypothetical protein
MKPNDTEIDWDLDDIVGLAEEPPVYLCTACHVNAADAANGYDTCEECQARA